jgi:poly(3-hydroxybutyrate) depolymerase
MIRSRRVLPALATAAVCVASIGAPTVAEGLTSWSSAQCSSWKKSYLKRHPHPTKAQKAKANKVLKLHGCTVRIK